MAATATVAPSPKPISSNISTRLMAARNPATTLSRAIWSLVVSAWTLWGSRGRRPARPSMVRIVRPAASCIPSSDENIMRKTSKHASYSSSIADGAASATSPSPSAPVPCPAAACSPTRIAWTTSPMLLRPLASAKSAHCATNISNWVHVLTCLRCNPMMKANSSKELGITASNASSLSPAEAASTVAVAPIALAAMSPCWEASEDKCTHTTLQNNASSGVIRFG